MSDFSDDDITTEPTEGNEDKDAGHGTQDTGDETTEADEDRDVGGDGEKDAGDEA